VCGLFKTGVVLVLNPLAEYLQLLQEFGLGSTLRLFLLQELDSLDELPQPDGANAARIGHA